MSESNGASDDCGFCSIARHEDPSADMVCEAERWVAFFPLEPATPGHTLIIPRTHVPDLWSLEGSLAGDLIQGVIRVGLAVMKVVAPEGMNLISSSGEAAEQTVFHLHFHVVPRWRRDGFGRIWPPEKPMEEKLRENLADRIRQACVQP